MRIKVRPSFVAYIGCIVILSSAKTALCVLSALLVHESGHLIAGKIAGEQVDQLELTPFGGVITCRWGKTFPKGIRGICVHAAGPLMNYGMIILSSSPPLCSLLAHDTIHTLITSNTSMLILNLLPVLPLDGGYVLFCIGYFLFPLSKFVFVLSTLGIVSGVLLTLLALYGVVAYGLLNCSLLIVGFYLIVSAHRSRTSMLAENICTIIQERMEYACDIRPIQFYAVMPHMHLLSLVPILQKNSNIHLSFTYENSEYVLNEETLCRMLLLKPAATISEAYFSLIQSKEKNVQNCFTS